MHWKKLWNRLAAAKEHGVQLAATRVMNMGVTHAASASDDSADPYANRKAVDTKINLNPNASRKVSRLMDASAKGTKNFSPVFGLSATPETTLHEAIVQMQKSSKYGK